jgi:hypothetical protein
LQCVQTSTCTAANPDLLHTKKDHLLGLGREGCTHSGQGGEVSAGERGRGEADAVGEGVAAAARSPVHTPAARTAMAAAAARSGEESPLRTGIAPNGMEENLAAGRGKDSAKGLGFKEEPLWAGCWGLGAGGWGDELRTGFSLTVRQNSFGPSVSGKERML